MRWVSSGRAMVAVSSWFGPRAKQEWVGRVKSGEYREYYEKQYGKHC